MFWDFSVQSAEDGLWLAYAHCFVQHVCFNLHFTVGQAAIAPLWDVGLGEFVCELNGAEGIFTTASILGPY